MAANPGEAHHKTRLTFDQVREIRNHAKAGVTQHTLAEWYKVGQSTIADIVTGRTWKTA